MARLSTNRESLIRTITNQWLSISGLLEVESYQTLTRFAWARYRTCPGFTGKAAYQASKFRTVQIR